MSVCSCSLSPVLHCADALGNQWLTLFDGVLGLPPLRPSLAVVLVGHRLLRSLLAKVFSLSQSYKIAIFEVLLCGITLSGMMSSNTCMHFIDSINMTGSGYYLGLYCVKTNTIVGVDRLSVHIGWPLDG